MSQSKGLNFYKIYVNPSEVPTVPAPDGINVVNVNTISTGAIYNLAGQKVSESYKGVVIQNGKKMIK